MVTASPETLYLADTLHDLHDDLQAFTYSEVLRGSHDDYLEVCDAWPINLNRELSTYLNIIFRGANQVISNFRQSNSKPRNLLTQTSVEVASSDMRPKVYATDSFICLAAELKMQLSLEYNRRGEIPSKRFPSAVLFGADQEPFAYVKSIGTHSALAWRDAEIYTASGLKVVPAGSFFDIRYGKDGNSDIQDLSRRAGIEASLISLEDIEPPTAVVMDRFSAFLIDKALAEQAYLYETRPNVPIHSYFYLRKHIPSTLEMSLQSLGGQVLSLLNQEKAHRVNPSILAA